MKTKERIEQEIKNLIKKMQDSTDSNEIGTYILIVGWLSWTLEDEE